MREFAEGRPHAEDSILAKLDLAEYGYPERRFSRYVLRPLLAGLSGDTVRMRRLCEDLARRQPYAFAQRNKYDALFLAGAIDETAYRAQPYRYFLDLRLSLLSAVKAEMRGDTPRALELYRGIADDPRVRYPDLFWIQDLNNDEYTMWRGNAARAFVLWREKELSSSAAPHTPRPQP
jgi:hypothetical protein